MKEHPVVYVVMPTRGNDLEVFYDKAEALKFAEKIRGTTLMRKVIR